MDAREPALPFGSASRSSTGMPMDTTLTGSGYVSSKTARRPWMALAAASEASLAYTGYKKEKTTNGGYDAFHQDADTEPQRTLSKSYIYQRNFVSKRNRVIKLSRFK